MSWDGVPLRRLLAVAAVAAVAVAAGALVVRLLCRPRQTRRAAVVMLVAIALACALFVYSSGPPAIAGQEVVIGQPFAYHADYDVTIRSVECSDLCVVEIIRTNTRTYMDMHVCGDPRFKPTVSLIGHRGTVYAPEREYPTACLPEPPPARPKGASFEHSVVFDAAGNGLVDMLDIRGSDEVAAVVMTPLEGLAGPDRYALIDPYNHQPRSWAAVGSLKLILFAAAGAAGAAVFSVKRRRPASGPPAGLVADPDVAERVLNDLIRSDRAGGPDTSKQRRVRPRRRSRAGALGR